ncbi:MATE family efflux transporter [uncultured Treponema sp.]|uniref:MATE family efflux transporter n=1 Tax=uncultured Treponema sp. TaxID=162155 RepID=UPI000E8C6B70|nr:MATE family efflux transporter [uncultured Treponema sp.]HAZ97437.1 MATE family efflux transporter [Treponema sp.]
MKSDYLTTKRPFYALFVFSLPIIIGNLFQQLYTMVDSAVVGRFVGEQALAAVGASYSLTVVFICVAIGGGVGSSVIVSKYFGARNFSAMKTAVSTAFLTFLGISIFLGAVGIVINRPLLVALKTPSDALDMALVYLRIYFLGLPFLFMYNVISSMFNALGKSRIPLVFLIFSSVLNVALDFLFVAVFKTGVAGAAWATLIAQGLSCVLSFAVFMNTLGKFKDSEDGVATAGGAAGCGRKFRFFDGRELASMAKIAIPSILQQSTVSIGMMLVQSVVNSFGSEALAGYSAFSRIASIAIVPMAALNNSMSSYTAQNIGAGKPERVVKGYHAANLMVAFFAVTLCLCIEIFYRPLISLFIGAGGSETALRTGQAALRFEGFFYCWIGFKMACDGLLRGAGDMKVFTLANLINLSIRVVVSIVCAPRFGIEWVWYSVPMGWFMNFVISFAEYRTGKWKRGLEIK